MGQDPTHGPGQAPRLELVSVPPGHTDRPVAAEHLQRSCSRAGAGTLNCPLPAHGLSAELAEQGVLLLNAGIDRRAKFPMPGRMPARLGGIYSKVIEIVRRQHEHLVFMLWWQLCGRRRRAQVDFPATRYLDLRAIRHRWIRASRLLSG